MTKFDELFEAKKYKACALLLDEYLETDPDNPVWLSQKALCYLLLEHYQEAILLFTHSLEIKSKKLDPYIFVLRGRCYFELRQFDEAVKDFRQALLLDSENLAVVERLACSLWGIGKIEEAIKLLEWGISKNPNPMAYWILFDLYKVVNQTDKAADLYIKGLAEFPNFANFLNSSRHLKQTLKQLIHD